jgi:hypothetical protein
MWQEETDGRAPASTRASRAPRVPLLGLHDWFEKRTQKIKFSMLAEARRVSLSNTSLSTSMKKPLQVSVGCQTAHSTEATASDLGGSERRQLLARIADLETALAAANARAFFGAEPQTSSRPDTVGPQSDAQSLLGADSWEPAQSVFGAVPQHHPHQLSDGPSTRGSTPSLRPISRGFTPDGHLDRAPPRSPNNSPSSLYFESRAPGDPPESLFQRMMRDPAFDATIAGTTGATGIGGALSASAVSAMKGALRTRVRTASKWLAELAAASALEYEPAHEDDSKAQHTAYLVHRYLSAIASLFVALCNLPPRQEYIALFREIAAFVDGGKAPPSGEGSSSLPAPSQSAERRRHAESDLGIAGRAALLGELNDLCSILPVQGQQEAELLAALKRSVHAMRGELGPMLAALDAASPAQHGARPALLSPALRMSGNRGGGGGSDAHNSGASWQGAKPWQEMHALPTGKDRRPAWLVKSESLPGLPDMPLMRRSSSRAARFGRPPRVASRGGLGPL